jgi:signal transduction histidine kinase
MAQLLHDLDGAQAHGKVRDALARTLHDPSLELFYWSPAVDGYVDFSGALHDPAPRPGRVMRPIAGDDGPLALLMLDEAAADETQLVDVTIVAARLALENERLQAEVRSQLVALRSATARIVDTGARERRRIERDLHDGAQQRLLAVSMELGAARAKLATIDDPAARGALDRAAAEVQQAITELRDLARGIYPMLLTQEGLGSAVRALAEQSPLPVDVTATDRRYPAAVEAAGYFVIAESVTNAVRHSGASGVEVRVSEAAGYLVVVVRDDGAGGASLDAGSGLRGLADRVTALDGRFTVSSPAGRGTCVRASLPCD